jgi:hypothetical protein
VTFAGREAIFKHEQGATYVAYLLLNPREEPIHALNLCLRVMWPERKGGGIAELVDPETGEVATVPAEARIQERSMGLEDAQTMREVLRTQSQLEALLEDPEMCDQDRRRTEQELIALYDYEKKHFQRTRDNAQRAAEAVGKAIKRFYEHLAGAVGADGRPHAVLSEFAEHIKQHVLVASGRGLARGGPRPGAGVAGCFTYEPPEGVVWGKS